MVVNGCHQGSVRVCSSCSGTRWYPTCVRTEKITSPAFGTASFRKPIRCCHHDATTRGVSASRCFTSRRLSVQVAIWDHTEFPLAVALMKRVLEPAVGSTTVG